MRVKYSQYIYKDRRDSSKLRVYLYATNPVENKHDYRATATVGSIIFLSKLNQALGTQLYKKASLFFLCVLEEDIS